MNQTVLEPVAPASTEPGLTLADPPPRTLGLLDQVALWGNLGMTLLGPVSALFVLMPAGMPQLSLAAAFTATVAGTLIGTVLLSLASFAGARTGAPAMVLMRGLFGGRLSYLPTILNLVQCLGWAIFELAVISAAAQRLLPWRAHWVYVVVAGAATTGMALRPLGAVRLLRRYALVAIVLAVGYLMVQAARHPLPSLTHGSWSGFWPAADVAIAVAVSWIPLAADYSRHARSARSAFTGSLIGYAVTQIACYSLGLLAFSTLASGSGDPQGQLFGAFLAVPVGWLAFAILIARELDESFTNVYSTVVSIQNLRPLTDRRVLAVAVGALTTLGALVLHIAAYQDFLYLLGSVFVPMFAVFTVRYFVLGRGGTWDTSPRATSRPVLLVPWLLGFAAYQLVNPATVGGWHDFWIHARSWLGVTPPSWASASIVSFVVAAAATLLLAAVFPALGRRGLRESVEVA
ncbi:putative hydroxymethylpyrimidine transporter CytX [Rugosimonospora acidiphila]|uniref:Hydroxymethylpyrimidine transporter CytX n=1 Tax=Rugosimonospora acidiphila TaxID=556531 RepID=A0ABP9SJU8_9ACTN